MAGDVFCRSPYNFLLPGHTGNEVIEMTPKEILYVEDALGHAQFLTQQTQNAASMLTDATLRQQAQQLVERNRQIFRQFYSLV